MKTNRQIFQSNRMRTKNADRLPDPGRSMYLAGAVKMCRAQETAKQSNRGKGWVTHE